MKIPEEVVNREEMLPQWLSSEVRHAFSGTRCTAQQVWRKIISLSGTSLPPAERLKSAVFDGTLGSLPHQPGFLLCLNLEASVLSPLSYVP